MRSIATATVTIYRGESTDAFGDSVSASTAIADRIPFSIMEQSVKTTRRGDDRPQSVKYFRGRCSPAVDIRQEDRIKDEITGTIYLVTAVSNVASTVTTNDTRCDLERVTIGTLA